MNTKLVRMFSAARYLLAVCCLAAPALAQTGGALDNGISGRAISSGRRHRSFGNEPAGGDARQSGRAQWAGWTIAGSECHQPVCHGKLHQLSFEYWEHCDVGRNSPLWGILYAAVLQTPDVGSCGGARHADDSELEIFRSSGRTGRNQLRIAAKQIGDDHPALGGRFVLRGK